MVKKRFFGLKEIVVIAILLLIRTAGFALDYYWIGNSGNWSDINHWATTSGGTILHTTVPSSTDDIYFDANSFNAPGAIVTLDVQNAFCRDLNWTGATNNPTFNYQNPNQFSANNVLRVFGSLTLIPNMTVNVGKMEFEGFSGVTKNIITAAHPLTTLIINEFNQQWELQDSLICDILYIQGGNLKTNNQFIEVNRLEQLTSNSYLELDSSIVHLRDKVTSVRFINQNYPFDAGHSTIIFKANPNPFNLVVNSTNQVFHNLIIEDSLGVHTLGNNNNFNKVISKGALQVFTDTIDSLEISLGKKLSVNYFTTAILNDFQFNGTCSKPVFIEGETSNQPTLYYGGGAINMNYLSTKNTTYTGGPWTATNSFDLGNNTGITLTQPPVSNLFWVGGTGFWSDINHWAFISGGPGGACLPNSRTNVIFDVNSFNTVNDTVKIDVNDAFCRDFSWLPGITGNPLLKETYSSKNQNLHVYGDIALEPAMDYEFIGFVWLESDSIGNIINTNGVDVSSPVYLNNINGEWNLLSNLTLKTNSGGYYNLYTNAGSFNTNGFQLDVSSINTSYNPAISNSNRKFDFDTSTVNMYNGWTELSYTDSTNFDADSAFFYLHGSSNIRLWKKFVHHLEVIDTNSINSINDGYYNNLVLKGQVYIRPNASDTLKLIKGSSIYILNETNIFKINHKIEAVGNCNSFITLYSHETYSGNVEINPQTILNISNLNISEIKNNGPTITVPNAINLGGNTGFTFPTNQGRTLYWVGNGGSWFNDTCWSLTSGGIGGNCIPTALDTVIFDQNSFSAINQEVQHQNKIMFVNKLIWNNVQSNTRFANAGTIWVYGDVLMDKSSSANFVTNFYLKSLNPLDSSVVNVRNTKLENIFVYRKASTIIKDSLQFSSLYQYKGTTICDSSYLYGFRFALYGSDSTRLILNNAKFDGWKFINEKSNLELVDLNSTIEVSDVFRSNTPNLNFNKVVITGQPSWAASDFYTNKNTINKAEFLYNSRIRGKTEFNSIFLDDNNLYEFQHADTQRIHRLEAMWNPCFPITIRSTEQGTQAHWLLPTDSIATDFMEIRDLNNAGPEPFYAGDAGIDQGNNSGIFFYRAPGFIYGFHDDTTMLACDPLTFQYELRTNTFQRADSFLWFNGSMDTSFIVTQSDTIRVSAFYGTCEVKDTVVIRLDTLKSSFTSIGLLSDTVLCWHDSLRVLLHKDTLNYSFNWNTGSTDQFANYFPDTSGYLIGEVTNGGQSCIDSIYIAVNSPPVSVADDTLICNGLDSIIVNAPNYDTYLWAGGGNTNTKTYYQAGKYWLKVIDSLSCYKVDTFEVFSPLGLRYTANVDSVKCFGEKTGVVSLNITGGNGNNTLFWENTLTNKSVFDSLSSGTYLFKAIDANGCFILDSIFLPQPDSLNYSKITSNPNCYQDTNGNIEIIPNGGNGNYSISWLNGASSWILGSLDSGMYYFNIQDSKGCELSDSIILKHPEKLKISQFFPDSVCENDVLKVYPSSSSGKPPFEYFINGVNYSDTLNLTFVSDTTFSLFLLDSAGCISDTLERNIITSPQLTLKLPQNIDLCSNRFVEVNAEVNGKTNGNFNLIWNDNAITGLTRKFKPEINTYYVKVKEGCNNKSFDTLNIQFFEPPFLDFDANIGIDCDGIAIDLQNNSSFSNNIKWVKNGEVINQENPSIILPYQGAKKFMMVGENQYCSDSLNIDFESLNIDSLIRSLIPNIFTPNEDGINDVFAPGLEKILNCSNLEIFSRWGNPVYSTSKSKKPWKGEIMRNGQNLNEGIYYYVLKFNEFSAKGSVTLKK